MKYKDSFVKYYVTNRLKNVFGIFLRDFLEYWWCYDCNKYHSPRIQDYPRREYDKNFRKEMWVGITCKEIKE